MHLEVQPRFFIFVCVITCSVLFLLPISITKLFRKSIGTIKYIILLLILLAQLGYFFSDTLKTILQNMNIWMIVYPSIFHVLSREGKQKNLHFWPNIILLYHIFITPFHHFLICCAISPFHHCIIAPFNWYHTCSNSLWYLVHYLVPLVDIPSPFF